MRQNMTPLTNLTMNNAICNMLYTLLGYSFNANTIANSTTIDNITDTSQISIGDVIIGSEINSNTVVINKTNNSLVISNNALETVINTNLITHANNIFFDLQTDFIAPTDNNYITITELSTTSSELPVRSYDCDTEIESFIAINTTKFQLHFYGDKASYTAKYIRACLESPIATKYLTTYGYSVYQVKKIHNKNKSAKNGSNIYKFALKFSLMNNTIVSNNIEATNQINNELIFTEAQNNN